MSEEEHEKSSENRSVKPGGEGSSDVEELRAVRDMVSEWLERARHLVRDIVNAVVEGLDGSKFGKEIVELYTSLKAAGMPENLVLEIVRDFYKKKLEVVPSLGDLAKSLSGIVGEGRRLASKGVYPRAGAEKPEKEESQE